MKPKREPVNELGFGENTDDFTMTAAESAVLDTANRKDKRFTVKPNEKDLSVTIDGFTLTPVGIEFPTHTTGDKWLVLGERLLQMDVVLTWARADWWAFGEVQRWTTQGMQLADRFGIETATLYTYGGVAKAIQISIRNRGLSFAHHRLVVSKSPSEQKVALDKAFKNGWTLQQLRRYLRGDSPTADVVEQVRAVLSNEQTKIKRLVGSLEREGESEDISQITQAIDEQIQYLLELRDRLTG